MPTEHLAGLRCRERFCHVSTAHDHHWGILIPTTCGWRIVTGMGKRNFRMQRKILRTHHPHLVWGGADGATRRETPKLQGRRSQGQRNSGSTMHSIFTTAHARGQNGFSRRRYARWASSPTPMAIETVEAPAATVGFRRQASCQVRQVWQLLQRICLSA